MKIKEKSSVNTIVLIVILMFVSRLVGLIRDTSLGQQMGANASTDGYFMAILLTTSLFLGLGSALATNLIPRIIKEHEEGKILAGRLFNIIGVGGALMVIVYYMLAPYIVRWFAVGYDEEKYQLTVVLTRYMMPAILFVILTYFFIGILQANEYFTIPAMVSIPFNLLFFVYLYTNLKTLGVEGLAVVTTLGWLVQLLFVMVPAIRHGLIQFTFSWDLRPYGGYKFFLALVPLVVITLNHQLNIMLDNNRGSLLGDGSISAIYYGNILFKAIVTTTVYGITAVMFPKFNRRFLEANFEGLYQSVINVLRSVFLLLIPMSVGLIILGHETITLVFLRGMFTQENAYDTIVAFTGYTSFMIAFGVLEVVNKAYFTLENHKTPLVITGIILACNWLFTSVLMKPYGLFGVAVGTSLAYYVGAIISMTWFFRGHNLQGMARLFRTFYKTVVASCIMGLLVWILKEQLLIRFLDNRVTVDNILIIGISAVSGILLYGLALLLVKEELITYNMKMISSKIRNRSKKSS